MMHAIFLKRQKRPRLRAAFIVLLMISIFIADTVTDFEIAFAVFYIAVILIAIGFLSTRGLSRSQCCAFA